LAGEDLTLLRPIQIERRVHVAFYFQFAIKPLGFHFRLGIIFGGGVELFLPGRIGKGEDKIPPVVIGLVQLSVLGMLSAFGVVYHLTFQIMSQLVGGDKSVLV